MKISRARIEELEQIMDAFDVARKFMRVNENPTQWGNGYPSQELILKDIEEGTLYSCHSTKGELLGAFYFNIGPDSTYKTIYEGEWLNNKPYGVIHRLASNGKQRGVADSCFRWAFEQCGNIKVDTHTDNLTMQNALLRNGFVRCGIIFIADGTERIAYQKEE